MVQVGSLHFLNILHPHLSSNGLMQHYLLLQRNLIYTAITRAKDLVVMVGTKKALEIALKNNAVSQRNTTLVERLRERDNNPSEELLL